MPPALKALSAQLAGVLGALLLARAGLLSGLLPLLGAQALIAALTASVLRSARWWIPIHLAFMPLVVFAHTLAIHPGWYLAAFTGLVLFYWTSFRTQVPLYLSNRQTAAAVASLLPASPGTVLDIGAGTGSLLRHLADTRPDCHFTGIELAPATWLLGRCLTASTTNITFKRGDLFAASWADYDVVYAFLSPVPMAAVWTKAKAEMRPGSLLISNSFEVTGLHSEQVVDVGDRRGTRLLCYRIEASRND
jgi:SAM-dependent methyltransferase